MLWSGKMIHEALFEEGVTLSSEEFVCEGVSIDSRSVQEGDLFIALRGDRTDGHLYLSGAVEKGAAAVLVDREWLITSGRDHTFQVPVISVSNTLSALELLAIHRRANLHAKVIGVTGSNGKTSTRDMLLSLAEILEGEDRVFASSGNLNNHIGLPLCLARTPLSTTLLILEMGMNHPGEIAHLSKIARPHISLITGVARAHMEFFRSIAEIAEAKLEITEGMERGGKLFFHGKSPGLPLAKRIAQEKGLSLQAYCMGRECPCTPCKGTNVSLSVEGISFSWAGRGVKNGFYFHRGMAWNLFASCLVMRAAGFGVDAIVSAAAGVKPRTPRRFQVIPYRRKDGRMFYLVDDSYNANQHSFEIAIEGLREILPEGRLGLAAGEMGELGEAYGLEAHFSVGKKAGELDYRELVVCGTRGAKRMAEGFRSTCKEGQLHEFPDVRSVLEDSGKWNDIIETLDALLVKGSRSARMDLLCDFIGSKLNA